MLTDVLRAIAGEGEILFLDELIAAGSKFNDSRVEKRSGQTWIQTLEEYESACGQVAEIARHIPAETWREVGTIPWYGAEDSLDDLIACQYYGHKRED